MKNLKCGCAVLLITFGSTSCAFANRTIQNAYNSKAKKECESHSGSAGHEDSNRGPRNPNCIDGVYYPH